MTKAKFMALLFGVCCFGLVCMPAIASDLDEVEQLIKDAFDSYESLRANMEIEATIPMQDLQLPVTGNGTMQFLKDEESGKFRQEITLRAPEPITLEIEMTVISDGKETVIINEMMGRRNIMRQDAELSQGTVPPGGDDLLEVLRREADVELLDDGEVDGHAVYVLEARPRSGSHEHFSRARIHIDKELGVMRLIAMYQEGRADTIGTVRFTNIELNPEIDPAIFEYE